MADAASPPPSKPRGAREGRAGRSPKAKATGAGSPSNGSPASAAKEKGGKPRDSAVVLQLTRTKMCAFFERGKCSSMTCRYAHSPSELRAPPNLAKTKMCKAFIQGTCKDGENCGYAHSEGELRVTEGIYKTQICNFYERGYCKKGDRCTHAHGSTDLRPPGAAPAATPPGKAAEGHSTLRQRRSPLPLAELLINSEGNAQPAAPTPQKSVAEMASLAFSPMPSSPLWGYGMHQWSPSDLPLWPRDPVDLLVERRAATPASAALTPEPLPRPELRHPWEPSQPDRVAVKLSERLASLDAVVRELANDVAGLRGSSGQSRVLHKI